MSSNPIHLLHVFPTFAVGGAQMRFAQLVQAHGRQYRHTVIALDNVTDMGSRIQKGVTIDYRRMTFDKHRLWSNLALFQKTVTDVAPDVLVTYNWGSIEWALANRFGAGRKHVHIEDGFGTEEAQRQLRRRIWTRRLALSGRHTKVVLPSRGLEQLALRVWKLPASRVLYIPNGISCERFFVDIDRRRLNRSPLVVGTLATLRREKNIARMIGSFSAISEVWPRGALQLLIVGDGPERQTLQALARTSPYADQIRFAGATQQPEQWYEKMDVFALSSDTEQMPFSVLEAMAAGLPIVSPAVGDVPYLVSPENAPQIVRADDEIAYRAAMTSLLSDAALRVKLGEANQHKAREQFDERLMAKRYEEVFG